MPKSKANLVSIEEAPTHISRRDLTRDVMRSVGECMYEWIIGEDRLEWSDGTTNLLCLDESAQISSSRAFNKLLLSTTEKNRDDVILSSNKKDMGEGVPYRLQYALSAEKLDTQSDIWIEDTGRWFADKKGKPTRAHGVLRIINERRTAEERLRHLSQFDPLTDLYNRSHLNVCLEEIFDDISRSETTAAFLVVELDHFELINSVFGYEAGDSVIVEVAGRLKENLRDKDIIGRFSGAKIGIILPESDERDMMIAGYRILNLLRENVVKTKNGPVAVTVSLGGVVIPTHASDSRSAFVAAHQALGESRRGRNSTIVSYRRDERKDEARRKAALMAEKVVSGLKQGRIHLAWQPIVDAHTKEIVFHEALIRLNEEGGDALVAGDFVTIAQSLGLIRLVDHHALDLALDALFSAPTARFSLNVSNDTACDPEWLSKLANAAHKRPDISSRLIIEITESHAAESLEEAGHFIGSLQDLGFKVALDDFGAGFTSFRNLKNLAFDIIKVDGQFVDSLESSHENQRFIKVLVELAQLFDAKTVVEWVEDIETADTLRDWGVTYLQGFHFGEPTTVFPWTSDQEKSPQKAKKKSA